MQWITNRERARSSAIPQVTLEYISRVLLAAIFLFAAVGKLVDTAGIQALMVSGGVPAVMIWPALLVDLVIALALISGVLWRVVLPLTAVYCVVLGLLFHLKPESPDDMVNLMKNFSLAGALILLAIRSGR